MKSKSRASRKRTPSKEPALYHGNFILIPGRRNGGPNGGAA
jgi:hypothetical protein